MVLSPGACCGARSLPRPHVHVICCPKAGRWGLGCIHLLPCSSKAEPLMLSRLCTRIRMCTHDLMFTWRDKQPQTNGYLGFWTTAHVPPYQQCALSAVPVAVKAAVLGTLLTMLHSLHSLGGRGLAWLSGWPGLALCGLPRPQITMPRIRSADKLL